MDYAEGSWVRRFVRRGVVGFPLPQDWLTFKPFAHSPHLMLRIVVRDHYPISGVDLASRWARQ